MNDSKAASNESESTTSAKPRMWMFGVWIGVVGLGGMILLFALFMTLGGSLNSRIAALRKNGEPVSLADLKQRYEINPLERNVAVALEDLRPEFETAYRQIAPVLNSRNAFTDPWTPEQANRIDAFVEQNKPLFANLESTIRMPEGVYGPVIDTSADVYLATGMASTGAYNREISRALHLKADALLARGDYTGAANTAVDMIRFGNLIENAPTMQNYLVSIAVRRMGAKAMNDALQSGEVSEEVRERMRKELGEHDLAQGVVEAMRTERAIAIERIRTSGGSFAMAQMLKPMLNEIEDYSKKLGKDGLTYDGPTAAPAPSVLPMQALHKAALSWLAMSRELRVLDALTASGDTGEPDLLNKLDLPDEVKRDPFMDDAPLLLRAENGGWTIYSVGPDKNDQGGGGDDVSLKK